MTQLTVSHCILYFQIAPTKFYWYWPVYFMEILTIFTLKAQIKKSLKLFTLLEVV